MLSVGTRSEVQGLGIRQQRKWSVFRECFGHAADFWLVDSTLNNHRDICGDKLGNLLKSNLSSIGDRIVLTRGIHLADMNLF